MTAKEIKQSVAKMKSVAKKVSSSKKETKAFLIKSGAYTANGNLRAQYK